MDGVGNSNNKVHVLAATNHPQKIDKAMRRRFTELLYIRLPDTKARIDIFKKRIKPL